ncbi:heavy metal-associated isoprenylated plant protein 9 isoform X1 [Cucurbita pepo subsp. pepo]|uniref:heavy metal-associated isoprenylated plant protein 9 isoform X1 n=1 Tax=Cucurbita pepo subsp. pepo TaxID=3664 RepID=UPI000C9D398F|nr:heavy metal-associated isoprenylated plant protein 9 isoform X1 [Cucurbita pepo subsp. pepo]
MGEEAVQMQQQQQEEAKVEEMKLEEAKPCPCPPIVLLVDLHCSGCAKKIEKCIMRIRGVEGVSIDMAKNEVTIKGIVDPDAVCAKITTKTKRVAKVLSPSPPLPEGEPSPHLIVNSQLKVVELNVNMHCDACAHQLKKKILKMRVSGVQTASTELSTGKVVVTGTMDGDKLVDYVYRRTKKQARIVPQPQPTATPPEEEPLKPEESKEEQAAPPPPPPPEEIKTEDAAAPQAQGTDTNNNNKEEVQPKAAEEGGGPVVEATAETKPNVEVEEAKAAEAGDEMMGEDDHESMKRMMYQYYQYQPLYVMERIPPPQLFSDENPNACCVL